MHVKTDSNFLFTYTNYMIQENHLPVIFSTDDLYHTAGLDEENAQKSYPFKPIMNACG